METGNEGVVDDNVIVRITPYGESFFEDVEDELITIVEIEGQIWHAGRAERKAGGPEE